MYREKFEWNILDKGVPAIHETECPVSKITQRSNDLVQIVNGLMAVQGGAGSTLPVDQMPGAVFDAIRIIRHESQMIEAAMEEKLYAS